ncbi:MAG: hypothetical protein NTU53_10705 [Planctomycetota bacterium]|nr:hypothetical protein [Planctomycetota bacterium]
MGTLLADVVVRGRGRFVSVLRAAYAGVCLMGGMAWGEAVTSKWANPVDGWWDKASNWSPNTSFPNNLQATSGETYNVIIDAAGAPYTVTVGYGQLVSPATLDSFKLNSSSATVDLSYAAMKVLGSLEIQAGTFAIGQQKTGMDWVGVIYGGTISGTGGKVISYKSTLDGVTLARDVQVSSWLQSGGRDMVIVNGLKLENGSLTIGAEDRSARVDFDGAQSISGTGAVVFGNHATNMIRPMSGVLTIGAGVMVRATDGEGWLDTTNGGLVNQGTISASGTGMIRTMSGASGAVLRNGGLIEAKDGGVISLEGLFDNAGLIRAKGGTVLLGSGQLGSVSPKTAELKGIDGTAGKVVLSGTWDNTGSELVLDAKTGSWEISSGTIVGGKVKTTEGTQLRGGTFQGATLKGNYVGLIDLQGVVTLDGAQIVAEGGGGLKWRGDSSLAGTGEVLLGGSKGEAFIEPRTSGSLTIGEQITIRSQTHGAMIAGYGGTVTNRGTILSEAAGQMIRMVSVTNEGLMRASNGGILSMSETFVNKGSIDVNAGSSLSLSDDWRNQGTITAVNANVTLGGEFTMAKLGTFNRSGGTVKLVGTLDNTGQVFALNSATGSWELGDKAKIKGGSVVAADGAQLVATGSASLDGVTLGADVRVKGLMSVENGTKLAGGRYVIDGGQMYVYTPVMEGTGEIVFGAAVGYNTVIGDMPSFTIGEGMIVRTGNGSGAIIGRNTTINKGLISAPMGGGVAVSGWPFINEGVIEAGAGTVQIGGNWVNKGRMVVGDGALVLDGRFTRAGVGTLERKGGQVYVAGTMDNSGGTLTLDDTTGSWTLGMLGVYVSRINGGIVKGMGGAKLYVAGSSEVDAVLDIDVEIQRSTLTLTSDGIQFDRRITLANTTGVVTDAWLSFDRHFLLGGQGEVVFEGQGSGNHVRTSAPYALTIGKDFTIRTGSQGGTVELGYGSNQGLISATTGKEIKIGIGEWQGTPKWSNGVTGILEAKNGGTLTLGYDWSNAGIIRVDHGTLNLGGSFTTPGMGKIERNGGTVNLAGTLTNTGATLLLDSTSGSWYLRGGTIVGGTVTMREGSMLAVAGDAPSTLDQVMLGADLMMQDGATVRVRGGLTLDGSLTGMGNVEFMAGTNPGFIKQTRDGLNIGAGVTVRTGTGGGTVGADALPLVNNGVISAETAGQAITLSGSSVSNRGVVQAKGGGTVVVNNSSDVTEGRLTGGNWRVYGGSTLRLIGGDIVRNETALLLDGPGSNFYSRATGATDALAGLASNAGSFTVSGGRAFKTAGPFANSGKVIAGAGSVLHVSGELSNTGSIDVGGNLIAEAGGKPATDVLGQIVEQIKLGRGGVAGIMSSPAMSDTREMTGLGAIVNDKGDGQAVLYEKFAGEVVGIGSILVKYTWNGDANLDGVVNADDYFLADSGYVTQKGGWHNGDFNYDGVVNADDYFMIDSAFIGQTGVLAGMGRVAAVPEAGAVGMMVLLGVGMIGRRKKR